MKITFEQFLTILEQADAVILGDEGICCPSVWRRDDLDDYHVSVFLKYTNDEWLEFNYEIDSDYNPTVEMSDESFTVIVDEVGDVEITPLFKSGQLKTFL